MSLEDQIFKLIKEIDTDRQIGDKRAEQFWDRTRVEQIGTPTYSNFKDWLNTTQSAGKLSEGVILSAHSPANGTLDVAAGPGFIKTTDSPIGLTKTFNWGAVNLALDDGVTSYIYIDYSAGTPAAKATTTRTDIEMNRMFTLGRAYRDGNVVHVVNSGTDLTNTARRNHKRLVGVRGFERDSGGVISESGERYLESTAGVFWLGANEIVTLLQNTNNGDRFTKWFHVGGVWDSTTGQQQVDNTQYDNGTDLVNLTANKYGTMWCYVDYDSHLMIVYGSQNGTLTTARAADPPDVPAFIRDFAILAARIIVRQGTANIIEFKSAYEVFFPHTTPSEHNDMGGLQGGQADQYYHLTAAEYGALPEYGSWTPDLQFGGAKVGMAYAIQTGWYTKIGRQVTVTSYFVLSSKGSSNGDAVIHGLPFPIANDNAAYAAPGFRFDNITFANIFQGYAVKNTAGIRLEEITEGAVKTTITDANFANNSNMMISFTYFID